MKTKNIIKLSILTMALSFSFESFSVFSKQEVRAVRQQLETSSKVSDLQNLTLRIESNISNGQYKTAFKNAKNLLTDARLKIGVGPKVNYQFPFEAPNILKDIFPIKMKYLSSHQRRTIKHFIKDLYGGYYPNLLNLYKRAVLLYVKAATSMYKEQNGKLFKRQQKNFVGQIVTMLSFPIHIVDPVNNNSYVLFEHEVYQDEMSTFFNTELYSLAVNMLGGNEETLEKLILDSEKTVRERAVRDRYFMLQTVKGKRPSWYGFGKFSNQDYGYNDCKNRMDSYIDAPYGGLAKNKMTDWICQLSNRKFIECAEVYARNQDVETLEDYQDLSINLCRDSLFDPQG